MITSPIVKKTSQELWNDYLFLTKEMSKFLDQQDMELFYGLMEQRETLQKLIEEASDDEFRLSVIGKRLLQSIHRINQNITLKLQYIVNNSRNQHDVSKAYDGLGKSSVGNRMDWQT